MKLRNQLENAMFAMSVAQSAVNKLVKPTMAQHIRADRAVKFTQFLVLETRNRDKSNFTVEAIFNAWEDVSVRRLYISRSPIPNTVGDINKINRVRNAIDRDRDHLINRMNRWVQMIENIDIQHPLPDVYDDFLKHVKGTWVMKSSWSNRTVNKTILQTLKNNTEWLNFAYARSTEWCNDMSNDAAGWEDAKKYVNDKRMDNHTGYPYSDDERKWLMCWIESRPRTIVPLLPNLRMEDGERYNLLCEEYWVATRLIANSRRRELSRHGDLLAHRNMLLKWIGERV